MKNFSVFVLVLAAFFVQYLVADPIPQNGQRVSATAGKGEASASASVTGNLGTRQQRPQGIPWHNRERRPSRFDTTTPRGQRGSQSRPTGGINNGQASVQQSQQNLAAAINAQQNAMLQDTQKRLAASASG